MVQKVSKYMPATSLASAIHCIGLRYAKGSFVYTLKGHLGECCRLHNNEDVEMAAHKYLQMRQPDLYCEGIFVLLPRWEKCSNVLRNYAEK
jgi:hypothetical protein